MIPEHSPCPCGSTLQYRECCSGFHNKKILPLTAEELMRSRYSAFCDQNMSYLFNTWDPAFRPMAEDILSNTAQYLSLQILNTQGGQVDDTTGKVTFIARYLISDTLYTMQETSSFVKKDGVWLYEEGENQVERERVKKNSSCPCGSGKKFKRCCHEK